MTGLTVTESSGWTAGFRTLLGKEMASWWRTRRWLVHLLLWPIAVTGIVFISGLEMRKSASPEKGLGEFMQIFFQLGGFFGLIGAIVVAQGAIVGERRMGTAAWVMTKPVSRHAFILSKLEATTVTFLLLSLVWPALVVLGESWFFWHQLPPQQAFWEAVGILAVHQVFYISLTIMLGTLFQSRGPVAGVALGFWIGGQIVMSMLPKWMILAMPWPIVQILADIALWKPIPFWIWRTVIAVLVWIVLFMGVALWRFSKEEL